MNIFLLALLWGGPLFGQVDDTADWRPVPTIAVAADEVSADAPKASITMLDGEPVPTTVKPNTVLFFSSADAVSAGKKGSILWIVSPDTIAKKSRRLELAGASVLVVEVGPDQYILTVHQVAISKGGEGDVQTITIPVRTDGPPPDPDVDPTPIPINESLTDFLKREVSAVVKDAAAKEAYEGIANAYQSIADTPLSSVEAIEGSTKVVVDAAAKSVKTSWAGIQTKLDQRLASLKTTGKLATVTDYVATWKEIAGGIRAGLGPQPPPDPDVDPEPDVDPDVNPLPTPGLHVLLIYEQDDITNGTMPPAQAGILTSVPFRETLQRLGAKWKAYDDDTTLPSDTEKVWRDAFALPRTSVPWVFISNGTKGYRGPWPANAEEATRLVEKYKLN
jgi:hypothetical protein